MIASPSYNRAYLASCLRHYAQIQPHGWASDTFGPLAEIPPPEYLKAYHI